MALPNPVFHDIINLFGVFHFHKQKIVYQTIYPFLFSDSLKDQKKKKYMEKSFRN